MQFTVDEIAEAFSAVANKNDWKRPIDAIVPVDRLVITLCAIVHHTATKPTVEPAEGEMVREGERIIGMRYGAFRVTALGYRAGPAN